MLHSSPNSARELHRDVPASRESRETSTFNPPEYRIFYALDKTLQWDPPADSLELAEALSYHFPLEKSLKSKMQAATMAFLQDRKRSKGSGEASQPLAMAPRDTSCASMGRESGKGNPVSSKSSAERPVDPAYQNPIQETPHATNLTVDPRPDFSSSGSDAIKESSQAQDSTNRSPETIVSVAPPPSHQNPTWSCYSGDQPRRRKRRYEKDEGAKVAANRGMACEEHQRRKVKCDPKICLKNKHNVWKAGSLSLGANCQEALNPKLSEVLSQTNGQYSVNLFENDPLANVNTSNWNWSLHEVDLAFSKELPWPNMASLCNPITLEQQGDVFNPNELLGPSSSTKQDVEPVPRNDSSKTLGLCADFAPKEFLPTGFFKMFQKLNSPASSFVKTSESRNQDIKDSRDSVQERERKFPDKMLDGSLIRDIDESQDSKLATRDDERSTSEKSLGTLEAARSHVCATDDTLLAAEITQTESLFDDLSIDDQNTTSHQIDVSKSSKTEAGTPLKIERVPERKDSPLSRPLGERLRHRILEINLAKKQRSKDSITGGCSPLCPQDRGTKETHDCFSSQISCLAEELAEWSTSERGGKDDLLGNLIS